MALSASTLIPLEEIKKEEIWAYWQEFLVFGERENVLWELECIDLHEYYRRQQTDRRNRRYGFFVHGSLCGMVRISSRINFEENGMIGYSIRPERRGLKYALKLLELAIGKCRTDGILPVTACVDVKNMASIHVLKKAGFIETGKVFDWCPNPAPRKAIEMILKE